MDPRPKKRPLRNSVTRSNVGCVAVLRDEVHLLRLTVNERRLFAIDRQDHRGDHEGKRGIVI